MKVAFSNGYREVETGMKFNCEGTQWEVIEPANKSTYSPSSLGGTPTFWCKPEKADTYKQYQREDGCVEFCGDSVAAMLAEAEDRA